MYKSHNAEYRNKWFVIDEHQNKIEDALKPYLSDAEYSSVIAKSNRASQIIALQSAHLKKLHDTGYIDEFRHIELQKILTELYNHQGASERIKNFPYPRQYTTLNLWFIKIFVLLVPLGLLKEFHALNPDMIWLTIPFGALSGWIFTTLEKIGEATESPFEGSANDIPITQMSRMIEIDLLEMINSDSIPEPIKPINNIIS